MALGKKRGSLLYGVLAMVGGIAAVADSCAAGVLGLENPASIADERRVYVQGGVFAGNDFAPLKAIRSELKEGYAPRDGRNLALIAGRATSSVEWQGVRLGAIYRQEWLAEAQKDTLDAYRNESLGLSHSVGRTYTLDYRLRGFEAQGLQIGKAFHQALDQNWVLNWGVGASLLQGKKVRSETWSGNATAVAVNTLAFNQIDVTRRYSALDTAANGFAAGYRDGDPHGQGYSVDLGLSLKRADGMRFDWTIGDAVSRMRWTSIPEITLSGTTVFGGVFPGGRKWRTDFAEHLPIKHALLWSIPVDSVRVELADEMIRAQHFPSLAVQKEIAPNWHARAEYDFRFKTVGLAVSHRMFHFGLRSDSLSLDKAHAVGVDGGLRFEF